MKSLSFFNESMATDTQNYALMIHSDNIYAEGLVLPKIAQRQHTFLVDLTNLSQTFEIC